MLRKAGYAVEADERRLLEIQWCLPFEFAKIHNSHPSRQCPLDLVCLNSKVDPKDDGSDLKEAYKKYYIDRLIVATWKEDQTPPTEPSKHASYLFEDLAFLVATVSAPGVAFQLPALDIAERVSRRILESESYRLIDGGELEWDAKLRRLAAVTCWSNATGRDELQRRFGALLEAYWIGDPKWIATDPFKEVRDFARPYLPPDKIGALDW
jgi:hypothetical protein